MPRRLPAHPARQGRQRGMAILIILALIGLGAAYLLVGTLARTNGQIERDKATSAALAQAKEALIGFAAGVPLPGSARPGDLPCPDANNDGIAETSCGNASGSTGQALRLGLLPWKTLGLPDLRDGNGERLWYAVSNNFKSNTRTTCSAPGQPGCLNSDSNGTITVRDSNGNVMFDGTAATGAVAVVFAAGPALVRQDGQGQNRACQPCSLLGVCTATPAANTPRCNPVNYLDNVAAEDNANFRDGLADGFIQGPVRNATGTTILNDQLIAITPNDLMPAIEKRVAGEVRKCLTEYTAKASNQRRYPWAAPLNPGTAPSYPDVSGSRFGRIPDTPFANTRTDSGNAMDDSWTGACNINSSSGWWLNWKEMVFYALADAYKPASPMTPPNCGACLVVNPPPAADKQAAVFVAGRRLAGISGGQPRTANIDKGNIANYLERRNSTPGDDVFERGAVAPTFNDVAAFAPSP